MTAEVHFDMSLIWSLNHFRIYQWRKLKFNLRISATYLYIHKVYMQTQESWLKNHSAVFFSRWFWRIASIGWIWNETPRHLMLFTIIPPRNITPNDTIPDLVWYANKIWWWGVLFKIQPIKAIRWKPTEKLILWQKFKQNSFICRYTV